MVLDLRGKLHLGAPAEHLTDRVCSLLHQGHKKLVVDLEFVTDVDSVGFGALVDASREVTCSNAQIVLVGVAKGLKSMIVISGLLSHFRIFDSEAEGVAALAPEWPGAPHAPDAPDDPEHGARAYGAS